ncbi:NADP-dependent oxidoreductase [Marinobacter psychrophilus]|uniref:NADP-dependent oxidoreductase n=1 Tax=Marinobacter psychrophilus TaxID=330734 RepID=UPI001B51624D|nr:NADP-dependent oxidoreductase [Marinobacter psychrophilus]MBQ0763616.1 NADP-dependent oxidoreductase [Marinobacter psychrophilus]MBQ0845325.1 NADP-dependent oxidoreductase [Marinobacter psychrophilus]
MSTYKAINLVRHLKGKPGPELFEVVEKTVPEPGDGEFLVKQAFMSMDPAMMGWMTGDTDSYIPPVELGTVMRSSGVGEVVASRHADFAVGDQVIGMFGWQEMALTDGKGINKVDKKIPPKMALAVFALPGLTATQGLFGCGHPKSGETLVVSGAAGSVGSIVGQLAKAEGLRVIGVVGSQEKADWIINELGFDGAVNYKTDDLNAKLDELVPSGIDVYFENTGGPIQHCVFDRMNAHGRIVVCGMIADYTAETPRPGPSWMRIIKKRLTIQGFTMPDHMHKAQELQAKLAPYVQNGDIKYRTHVLEGLESAMDGLNLFLSGGNKGKLMVKI